MGRDGILETPPHCPGEEPREGGGNREALCRCCLLTPPPASETFLSACLFAGSIGTRDLKQRQRPCPCRIRFARRQTHQLLIALSAMINACTRSRLKKGGKVMKGVWTRGRDQEAFFTKAGARAGF